MTVKEFLQKGRKLEIEIKQLKEARQKAYELATSTTVDYSAEKVQTSSDNSAERKFAEYAEYSQELDQRIEELSAYRKRMLKLINKLDNSTYRTLLVSRYINCNTWEEIAEKMEYSDVWVRTKLHSDALMCAEKYYRE